MNSNKFLSNNLICTVIFLTALFVSCSSKTDYLPDSIFNLTLKQKMSGDEAKKHLNKIHFNPVDADKDNDIGFYQGTGNNATIYVTYYSKEVDAIADFDKMTQKISPENSVFISPSFFDFEGYKIYRCFGMGQTHFVFVHKTELLWISVGTISGKDFIKSYISYIK